MVQGREGVRRGGEGLNNSIPAFVLGGQRENTGQMTWGNLANAWGGERVMRAIFTYALFLESLSSPEKLKRNSVGQTGATMVGKQKNLRVGGEETESKGVIDSPKLTRSTETEQTHTSG